MPSPERLTDEAGINRLLYEAVTVNNLALTKGHEYRQNHYQLYGLKIDDIPTGDAMPPPWTGSHYITNNLKRLIEFSYRLLDDYYPLDGQANNGPPEGGPLDLVRRTLPSLTAEFFYRPDRERSVGFEQRRSAHGGGG